MTDTYEQARTERSRPLLAAWTAETQAAFLLPHLRPGMDLLDVGCGPGTITVGLAAAVAPGRTIGLDLPHALPPPAEGVEYVAGDATELPFPDASFDAIFISTVLQHLPEPLVAVREARRVARPGAVIGLIDADWGGQLMHPSDDRLARSLDVALALRKGRSPCVGRELRALLVEAGFVRCVGFARAGCDADPEKVRAYGTEMANGYAHPAAVERVTTAGLATAEEMAEFSAAWHDWAEHPGGYVVRLWCEAIGFVDQA